MLEVLSATDHVIALKITGKLGAEELETVTGLVEASLAATETTHIFIEVSDFSGFDPFALPAYFPRAFAMLGKLNRFGRIAVVSDLRWIRWATRLESALLPHIRYETFTEDERDQALAWVEGRRELPHGASIRIIETDKPDVLGFALDGKISAAEAEAIAEHFNNSLERGRPLRLLGRVGQIEGAELGALFGHKYLEMKIGMLERVERYAVVGGPIWLCAWVAALDPILKMDLRHFPADEEARAWAWLGARPQSENPLVA